MARVRPHFKVHTSVAYHPKMAEIYPSNDLLALWLRLGVTAISRYAARSDDKVRIHRNELSALTGGKRRDKAEATLKQLAGRLQVTLKQDGEYFELQWRNLAKKQGFLSKNGTETAAPYTNTKAYTETKTETLLSEWGEESVLSPDFVEDLRQLRPGGVLYTEDQVRDWFLAKQPQMAARGIKNFRRAAINWFGRASRKEVDSACRWVGVVRAEAAGKSDRAAEEKSDFEEFAKMFETTDGDE